MPTMLTLVIIGALILYAGYLRLQLHINRRIISAFQAAAVVVPPSKPRPDSQTGLFAVGVLLLAFGVVLLLVR